MDRRLDPRTLAALGITIALWSSAFPGIRAALEGYSPGHLAVLRFLIASLAMGVYAVIARVRLPRRRDIPALFGLGFLGVTAYHLGLSYGEVTVSAGAASVLIATGPVFTTLLATAFLGERVSRRGWVGVAVAFAGVSLVAFGEGGGVHADIRALLILGAAFSTSLYFVLQKPYLRRYGASTFTCYTIWTGTLLLLPFAPGLGAQIAHAATGTTLAVVYLGIFPAAIAYATWAYALNRAPTAVVANFIYMVPVLAIAIAWVWRHEVPALLSLVGGVIAVSGVVLVNTRGAVAGRRTPVSADSDDSPDG
jgi:drug/metabolite transporter (DMT)-like permease